MPQPILEISEENTMDPHAEVSRVELDFCATYAPFSTGVDLFHHVCSQWREEANSTPEQVIAL